jgi:hypothetical protein
LFIWPGRSGIVRTEIDARTHRRQRLEVLQVMLAPSIIEVAMNGPSLKMAGVTATGESQRPVSSEADYQVHCPLRQLARRILKISKIVKTVPRSPGNYRV